MPTCDGSCGSGNWSVDRRRAWSEDHGGSREARVLAPPVPFPGDRSRSRPARLDRALAGRAGAPELQRRALARWRGPEPRVTVPARDPRPLRDRTILHLGDDPQRGALLAVLPRGHRAWTDPMLVLDELLPELGGGAGLAWRLAAAEARVRRVGPAGPGLFWDGPQAPEPAAWALAALRSGSTRPLVVGPMPASYGLPPESASIVDDGLGRLRLAGARPLLSWRCDDTDHALEQTRGAAAMADVYLWWAHRLHSFAHVDGGTDWDLWLGRLAALRALSWIDRMASHLAHLGEVAHA